MRLITKRKGTKFKLNSEIFLLRFLEFMEREHAAEHVLFSQFTLQKAVKKWLADSWKFDTEKISQQIK